MDQSKSGEDPYIIDLGNKMSILFMPVPKIPYPDS